MRETYGIGASDDSVESAVRSTLARVLGIGNHERSLEEGTLYAGVRWGGGAVGAVDEYRWITLEDYAVLEIELRNSSEISYRC